MSRAQRYFRRRCLNVPDLSAFGCGGARGGTLGGLRCNAAGRGSSCKLASPVPVLLIPAGLLIIGGGTHRIHSQLTYPYTTRTRGPVIPFQGWR